MKVHKYEKPSFVPVTVTFESQAEIDCILLALGEISPSDMQTVDLGMYPVHLKRTDLDSASFQLSNLFDKFEEISKGNLL